MIGEGQTHSQEEHAGNVEARNLHTLFSALGDSRRLFIFQLLLRGEKFCVSEIAQQCDISVPAASQQLRVLERAGLVIRQRDGQRICYDVNTGHAVIQSLVPLL